MLRLLECDTLRINWGAVDACLDSHPWSGCTSLMARGRYSRFLNELLQPPALLLSPTPLAPVTHSPLEDEPDAVTQDPLPDDSARDSRAQLHASASSSELVQLLGSFLVGSHAVKLGQRLLDLHDLPDDCRTHVAQAKAAGRAWAAWSTVQGPMAAWGDYDRKRSVQIRAHVMFVEWWLAESGHHSLWGYCYPKRETEWIVGRGR